MIAEATLCSRKFLTGACLLRLRLFTRVTMTGAAEPSARAGALVEQLAAAATATAAATAAAAVAMEAAAARMAAAVTARTAPPTCPPAAATGRVPTAPPQRPLRGSSTSADAWRRA